MFVYDIRLTFQVALSGIENILKVGAMDAEKNGLSANPYAVMVEECSGLDKIEFLQQHENMEVYLKAYDLIEKYFSAEDEQSGIAPEVDQANQQFQLHVPMPLQPDQPAGEQVAFNF